MKKYLLLILFCFLSTSSYAQRINDLPQATFLTGNESVPVTQNGVTKRATTSQFLFGSFVLGYQSGGTGLSTLGPPYEALQVNPQGLALTYDVLHFQGGGTGLSSLGPAGDCLAVNPAQDGYVFVTCGGGGPTPPPSTSDFIITENSDPIVTETGDNIVTETSN